MPVTKFTVYYYGRNERFRRACEILLAAPWAANPATGIVRPPAGSFSDGYEAGQR